MCKAPAPIFWLAREALSAMQALADEAYPLETGGMLLGYEADNRELVLSSIIGPGPEATHKRLAFVPDARYQQAQIENTYRTSAGRITYLGDWHTHPSGEARLSARDRRTLAHIAHNHSGYSQYPAMLILAGTAGAWEPTVCRFAGVTRKMFRRHYHVTPQTPVVY